MATFVINAVIYLVAISVLVAVHEFGHFWVARRVGVKVLRFSIGFGRVIWSRPLKDGTEFALSAIPIGGYVSMLGERDDNVPAREAHRAFKSQPPSRRIAIMAAGPIANFLFAILIYWILFMVSSPGLKPVIGDIIPESIAANAGLRADDLVLSVAGKETPTREAVVIGTLKDLLDDGVVNMRVVDRDSSPRDVRLIAGDRDRVKQLTEQDALLAGLGFDFWYPPIPAKLGAVEPGSSAERAGLRPGDMVVRFDGERVTDFRALRRLIQDRADRQVDVQIDRAGRLQTLTVQVGKMVENGKTTGRIGVGPARVTLTMPEAMILPHDSPVAAFGRALDQTWDKTVFVFQTVGYLIAGKVSLHSVSGPVGIATVAGEAARIGLLPFISLLALVSISIGALNLLPIPVLDGGQIVFQVAELLKGRPVSERAQMVAQQVGITLLILLTALALFNDIARLS